MKKVSVLALLAVVAMLAVSCKGQPKEEVVEEAPVEEVAPCDAVENTVENAAEAVENAAEADRTIAMLMGDDVAPRREFIEENATYANIDA